MLSASKLWINVMSNDIALISLPPHATHLFQPLDPALSNPSNQVGERQQTTLFTEIQVEKSQNLSPVS